MSRITCVAGARPNFMKIKPIVDALVAIGVDVELVHTGQHYDAAMSDVFFDDLGLRKPDAHLDVGSGSHGAQTAAVMVAFERYIEDRSPDAVVVVGDVNSTLACSIVSAKAGVLLAHVEAGLRSRDWSMPEEVNRVCTDRASDLLLAPSSDAIENLRSEGYREDQIHLVGNVMIDTLLKNRERAIARPLIGDLGLGEQPFGVVTLHRPSNVDEPSALASIVGALNDVAAEIPLLWPTHPRTMKALESIETNPDLRLLPPMGYLDFLALQASAAVVLTDSGGIQEETTALGVPCLTLRENTERPITITEGTNRLVGTDPAAITEAALSVLLDPPAPRCPALWDGHAGERIATVIESALQSSDRKRPTDL